MIKMIITMTPLLRPMMTCLNLRVSLLLIDTY